MPARSAAIRKLIGRALPVMSAIQKETRWRDVEQDGIKPIGVMSLRVTPASVGTKKLVGDATTAISTIPKGMHATAETSKPIGGAKIVIGMWPRDMRANATTKKPTGIAEIVTGTQKGKAC